MIDRARPAFALSTSRCATMATAFALAAGALCLAQPSSAATQGAAKAPPKAGSKSKAYDNTAPVNYSADRIEVQDKANRVVLTGNVDIIQDTMHLRAARVTVSYTNNGSLKIQQMIATGSVYVTRGTTDTAQGDVGVYDLVKRIITMSGHVTVNRSGDVLRGGHAVINLATGVSTVDGRSASPTPGPGSNGRVSGTFTPASSTQSK